MLGKTVGIVVLTVGALSIGTTGASAARYYYGSECQEQNRTAGTIIGAIAGGIIGSQFGHGGGKAAATVGGVVLGGAAGNAIGGDISCEDRRYAMRVYSTGVVGPIGRRYEWRNGGRYGYFTPTREYWRGRKLCRDFEEGVWRRGRWVVHNGGACRNRDGDWEFL